MFMKIMPIFFCILGIIAVLIAKKYICDDTDIFENSPVITGTYLDTYRNGKETAFHLLVEFEEDGKKYIGKTGPMKKSSLKCGDPVEIKYRIQYGHVELFGLKAVHDVKIINNDKIQYINPNYPLRKLTTNGLIIALIVMIVYIWKYF